MVASPERGHHLFGQQFHGLGARVIAAPWREAGAAEIDVGVDLLPPRPRPPDQVAFGPRIERLPPERLRAGVDDLGFGLADEPPRRPRLLDLVVVAPNFLAVV